MIRKRPGLGCKNRSAPAGRRGWFGGGLWSESNRSRRPQCHV